MRASAISSSILRTILALILSVLAAGATAQTTAVDTQTTATAKRSPRLRNSLSDAWAQDKVWDDGQMEMAIYETTTQSQGAETKFDVLVQTKLVSLDKEFYSPARFPYGDKPLLKAIQQSMRWTTGNSDGTRNFQTTVFVPRESAASAMRFALSVQGWEGSTSRVFQLWDEKPKLISDSPSDGKNSGVRDLVFGPDNYYEEELPLLLRGLKFEDGLTLRLSLYPTQVDAQDGDLTTSPSTLTVTREDGGWNVHIDCRDGRKMEFVFAVQSPFVMKRFEHSDGREMLLKELGRGMTWSDISE